MWDSLKDRTTNPSYRRFVAPLVWGHANVGRQMSLFRYTLAVGSRVKYAIFLRHVHRAIDSSTNFFAEYRHEIYVECCISSQNTFVSIGSRSCKVSQQYCPCLSFFVWIPKYFLRLSALENKEYAQSLILVNLIVVILFSFFQLYSKRLPSF